MIQLHHQAHALTIFREFPSGEGREYTAAWFPSDPWSGCERFIRTSLAVGWIEPTRQDSYGILDVLNAEGDIVQDWSITSARTFQKIKMKLGLVVVHSGEEKP